MSPELFRLTKPLRARNSRKRNIGQRAKLLADHDALERRVEFACALIFRSISICGVINMKLFVVDLTAIGLCRLRG